MGFFWALRDKIHNKPNPCQNWSKKPRAPEIFGLLFPLPPPPSSAPAQVLHQITQRDCIPWAIDPICWACNSISLFQIVSKVPLKASRMKSCSHRDRIVLDTAGSAKSRPTMRSSRGILRRITLDTYKVSLHERPENRPSN